MALAGQIRPVSPLMAASFARSARSATSFPSLQSAAAFLVDEVDRRLQTIHVLGHLFTGEAGDILRRSVEENLSAVSAVRARGVGGRVAEDAAGCIAVGLEVESAASRVFEAQSRAVDSARVFFAEQARVPSPVPAGWGPVPRVVERAISVTYRLNTTSLLLARQLVRVAEAVQGGSADPFSASLVRDDDLMGTVQDAMEEMRGVCIEKHGAAPEFRVERGVDKLGREARVPALIPHHYLRFALLEVAKNAAGAMVKRFGALRIDDAPPIHVVVAADDAHAGVRIADTGGGCPDVQGAFRYFRSSALRPPARDHDYKYSRDHGVVMSGLGVGLPRTRDFAQMLGGYVDLVSLPGHGATVQVVVNRRGHGDDVSVADVRDLLAIARGAAQRTEEVVIGV
jgi:signal transduction histidine kinase